jgi:DNA-binding transcriptional LysR family regulator
VGEQVLAAAAPVVEATRDIEAVLEEHREAAVGTLRVATTHDLGPRFVAPVAAALVARHPQLRVDIVADDAPQDLIAGNFDLAVRLGAPRDSGHVMRRLGVTTEPIVAAPALADRYLNASRPRDLAGAPWARHALLSRSDVMTFRGPRGEHEEIPIAVRAQANTGDGLRALLLAGVGFGALPEHLVTEDLRRGALVRVCPEWIWKQLTLYAVLPSAKTRPKRVTLFLAALKEALASAGVPGV